MAITKGAKKAVRTSERKRVFNLRRTTAMREVVKSIRKTAGAGDVASAKALLPKAYQAIDKAAKRGVIKANTAARKKARLAATIKKVEKGA
jgi:small subunit ribosomal protein S20